MVNHLAVKKELAELRKMVDNLDKLQAKLLDTTLPHYEHQAISAAITALKEIIVWKTMEVKHMLKIS